MTDNKLTQEDYELSLVSLMQRINEYVENGQGDPNQLLREAEELLDLKDQFPQTYEEHQKIEGLLASLMARKKQQEFMTTQKQSTTNETRGCLLGWLFTK